MFAHLAMRFARMCRVKMASFQPVPWRLFAAALLGLVLQACSETRAEPVSRPDPSKPQVRVPATPYRPVTGGYVSRRPVEPLPWRERNDRVAPPAKP